MYLILFIISYKSFSAIFVLTSLKVFNLLIYDIYKGFKIKIKSLKIIRFGSFFLMKKNLRLILFQGLMMIKSFIKKGKKFYWQGKNCNKINLLV